MASPTATSLPAARALRVHYSASRPGTSRESLGLDRDEDPTHLTDQAFRQDQIKSALKSGRVRADTGRGRPVLAPESNTLRRSDDAALH